ncbi:hypothetical protein L873DRAFT_1846643 [Choiromyces venosus 120613-1]|uniref:Restriction endonuclease domain-containing protein n=1 Tax=Choiromyces venosus 120613-1 TaxID=1336337 RepID=A0A3N4J805_9PEZI|nr:hypothetical protein L873DRAFT_1846643 [Choiromyces venosus 120613-1]
MMPDELSKLLLEDEYLVLDIPCQDFSELEKVIGRRAYTYRPAIQQLTIKMPTQMHGTIASWAMELIMVGTNAGAFGQGDLSLVAEGELYGFTGEHQDITKTPDMAIIPEYCFWPTVVFEFGYTEPYDDLKADVKLLLEGSAGGIIKVILIKLKPIQQGETNI